MKAIAEQEGSQDRLNEFRENQELGPLFEQVAGCLDEKIRAGKTYRFQREVDRKRFEVQVYGLHYHSFAATGILKHDCARPESAEWAYTLIGTMPPDLRDQRTSVMTISKTWGEEMDPPDYQYLLRARTVKIDFWQVLGQPIEPGAGQPVKNPWLKEALVGVLGWEDPLPRLVWKEGASLTERYLLALIKDIPDWEPIKEKNS